MSFRNRLAALFGVFTLVLVLITSLAVYRVVDDNLHGQVDGFLRDRVSSVSERLEAQQGDPFRGRRFRNPLGDALLDARFDVISQVIDVAGRVAFTIGEYDLPVGEPDVAVANGAAPIFRDVDLFGSPYRMYVVPIRGGGALQLGRDIEEISESMAQIRWWLTGIGLSLVVLATIVGWLLARVITAPIRELSDSADLVATTGSLDVRIEESGAPEVRSLARSLNTMLGRIRGSFDRERQFVQDASHELRTPITSLRVNTELLERSDIDPAERDRILRDMRNEVDSLTAISTELATLAIDQREAEQPVDVNLADATEVVVDRVRRRTARDLRFESRPPHGTVLSLRLSQFERALGNLLDNAIKFTPGESSIEVVVDASTVTVVDHGVGIPDDEKERVFERFFRSDSTRALPGSGLGLAIAKQFADDHAASISVSDTPGGGATFHLRF